MLQWYEKLDGEGEPQVTTSSVFLMIIDLCKLNFGQVKYKATNFQTKFSITYVNFFPSLQDLCYVFFYFYKDFNNLVTTKRFFEKLICCMFAWKNTWQYFFYLYYRYLEVLTTY